MEFRGNVAPLPVQPDIEPAPARPLYRRAELSAFRADPDAFYEFTYRATIDAMVAAIVDAEFPVRDDVVAQRIARAHGWLQTGSRIRERVDLHLKKYESTSDGAGRFLWAAGSVRAVVPFRRPATEEDLRPLADVAVAELAGFIVEHIEILDEPDPPVAIARLLGLKRLAATTRARLDEAIEVAAAVREGRQ